MAMFQRFTLIGLAAALCGAVSMAQAQAPSVDWKKQETEILRRHAELVRIDSSSPPGNETKVVDYLKAAFEAEGIETKTFALNPARANLVARLKGNGKKRPLLL